MKKNIRILRKKPGKPFELIEVRNDLKPLQEEVGGYIEVGVWIDRNAVVLCNEDGWDLDINISIYGRRLRGTILILGVEPGGENGDEFTDCPDVFIKKYLGKGEIE